MTATRADATSAAFIELTGALVTDLDVTDVLDRLIGHALTLLDVDAAGIMLADTAGRLRVMASSSNEMQVLELFELQVRSGPCLDAFTSGETVAPADAATMRSRWPLFTRDAAAAGFRSVQAVPMRLRADVVGAFTVFSRAEGGLSAADLRLARALADVATLALITDRTIDTRSLLADRLQGALSDRVVIEQAKGMLAQRAGITVEDASAVMKTRARETARPVRSVAADVVAARGHITD